MIRTRTKRELFAKIYEMPWNWHHISQNPSAIRIIEACLEHPDFKKKINYARLSFNSSAIHLIEKWVEEGKDNFVNWDNLSRNQNAIDLLDRNQHFIDWDNLSGNPSPQAKYLLNLHYHKINWAFLHRTKNIFSITSITDWNEFCVNPESSSVFLEKFKNGGEAEKERFRKFPLAPAVLQNVKTLAEMKEFIEILPILKNNMGFLSSNENIEIIDYLSANSSLIDWERFSKNKNAIHVMAKHLDKIDPNTVFLNTNVYLWEYLEECFLKKIEESPPPQKGNGGPPPLKGVDPHKTLILTFLIGIFILCVSYLAKMI